MDIKQQNEHFYLKKTLRTNLLSLLQPSLFLCSKSTATNPTPPIGIIFENKFQNHAVAYHQLIFVCPQAIIINGWVIMLVMHKELLQLFL